MITVFVLSAGFVVYTYALYPLWLHWRARRAAPLRAPEPRDWPRVSIVMAAHNEAAHLPNKFRSLEALDYPSDKLEWVIVSDGSTDDTVDVVTQAFDGHDNRLLHHYPVSKGKCAALNAGVARATGDVILFMDARQPVAPNVARCLVPYLCDANVGAATGELVLSDNANLDSAHFGLYWRYEKWIRENQSRLFSTTGATGALYAIRRADFEPNPDGTLLDDFDTPVGLLKLGKRTVYVPGAYAFDSAVDDIRQEFRRKVRNLAGNWQSFRRHRWLFSPNQNPVWWQFLSHKFARLLVPWALILAFVSASLGEGWLMSAAFWAQVLFYSAAFVGYLDLPFTRQRALSLPKVFVQMNLAALVATIRFFCSDRAVSWR